MAKKKKVSRKERMEQLRKRHKRQVERKDKRGKYKSIFKEGMDIPFWRCEIGEHLIDVIPYIAGRDIPEVCEKGEYTPRLEVFVHFNVGVNQDAYVCLARTFGQPCPVCEEQNKLRDIGASDDEIRALEPSRRDIYNIVCRDSSSEEKKGVQVWEVANWFMGKHLEEMSERPKLGGTIVYSDPDEGKSIYFKRKGTGISTEYLAHNFGDREEPISDEILDSAYTLDELIHWPTYEEVAKAFFGSQYDDEEEEEEEIDTSEEEEEDAEAEEEEETEDEGEEDSDNPCPHGFEFGADADVHDECDDCNVYDDCLAEQERMEEEEKEEKPKPKKRKKKKK